MFRNNRTRAREGAQICAALLLLWAFALPAQDPPPFVSRPDEDLLLFSLDLGEMILSDGFPAYQSGPDLLLPLDELARLLTLALRVDVVAGTAEGFVVEEDNRFFLDARRGVVIVGGTEQSFAPSEVEIHQEDIYVPIRLLSRWLPLEFEVVLLQSRLVVHSTRTLPIELRRQRASRGLLPSGEEPPLRFPLERTPYALLSLPAIDLNLSNLYSEGEEDSSSEFRYSTRMTGDLLFSEFDFFTAGTPEESTDTRFTLARRDPDSEMLGPLRAREVQVGTIYFEGSDLLNLGTIGEGIIVSNYPLKRSTRFDRYTFRGSLPQGWDVELYRNDVLIGFARSRPDGLYEFRDVPLLFGINLFRLVFYGPQGERREETRRFNVADSFAPKGELYYRVIGNRADLGDDYVMAEADYGLTRRFTALFGASHFISGEREGISIAKGGIGGFFGSFAARAELAADSEGETAASVSLQGRLRSTSFFAQHAQLGDFAGTLANPSFPGLRDRSTFRLDGALPTRVALNLPYSMEARREGYADDGIRTVLLGRVGTAFRGTSATLELDGNWYDSMPAPDQFFGRALFNRRLGNWLYRAMAEYQFEPGGSFRSVELVGERRFGPSWFIQTSLRRYLLTDSNLYGITIGRSEGLFGFSGQATWSEESGLLFSSSVSAGAIRDTASGAMRASSRTAAGYGYVSARVFLDNDRDGLFGPGDEPLPGARLFANRSSREGQTGKDGFLLIGELPIHEKIEVALDAGSLEDPLLVPTREGTVIVPRPGKVTRVDFPVTLASEIAGTVVLREASGVERELGGVRVVLVGIDGTVMAETVSSFDGFFELLGVPPGTWRLMVHEEQTATSGLRAEQPLSLELRPGDVLDRVRLTVTR